MNKCLFIGRLTADVKTNTTEKGNLKASFSIAVNSYGDKADFINIVAWGKTAENVQKYLTKGKRVAVTGRLSPRSYTDKDGNNRVIYEINADEVEFLSPRDQEEELTEEEKAERARKVKKLREELTEADDEELPF